ncbi:MerC family mercury resistance protein [Flavobacterium sp.]
MRLKPTSILDILGISSATICLVHCFVFPLLSILQFNFVNNPWIDIAFASIGMFLVSKILMGNSDIIVKFILLVSILIVIFGIVLEIIFKTDSFLILLGGIGMITGHIVNLKTHKH